MPEQEQTKVYELAKELGIDSISLLDKLKSLNIKVKNHMSELGNTEVELARESLKPAEKSAKSAKKTTATKSTTVKSTAAKTRKKTETATGGEKTATASPAATPSRSAAAPEASGAKASSPIIRRRMKADGATETVTQGGSTRGNGTSEPHAADAGSAYETESHAAAESEHLEMAHAEEETPVEMEAQPQTVESESAELSSPAAPESETEIAAAPPAATPAPGRPAVVLTPRPVAPPRKSFLKIVEATPLPPKPVVTRTINPSPVKPLVKGLPSAADKDGFRIIKMTKENLDQMAEEEAAKKRGGGGGRTPEIRPEDVRFADYRKKEMVFLPKKKRIPVGKEIRKTQVTTAGAKKRVVVMQDMISVQDLAAQLSVKAIDVVRKLMGMGQMATINQSIDFDTATLVAHEYQYEIRSVAFKEEEIIGSTDDTAEELLSRPPVVTIMGHVDHGKTTLLDSIREANVAAGEAGGITQHIGAYTVEKNGKLITFIDTPGHEAFTVMRARGANVTDIVILVVSADDGVMPQTREALSHAQAAKVPIIVAVNKIDKPGANPEKIKQGLAELNLLAEDWGGETQFVQVSALKKTNIDKLLDAILLQAEVLDLKANPKTQASGTILEAKIVKGRGAVVSLLVNRGTLRVGDPIVSGTQSGKVRAMMDDKGRSVKEVTPGIAAEVQGFEGVPSAGEPFTSTTTEAQARDIAQNRTDKARNAISGTTRVTLDDLFSKIKQGDIKELNVILKADTFGSVEAIRESLIKSSTEKVKVKVILSAPGGITESDVLLASASEAIIIGFNVRPETKARQIAESEHIEIKCYSIIYELLDEVKKSMTGLLDKKKVEKFLGRAEVRQTFNVPKIGTIAGSSVIDGKIVRGANVRLLRDSRVIFEGKMSSLRRFKDDAKEVATGFECGIGIENYNDLKPGDLIEAYQIEMIAPTLDS